MKARTRTAALIGAVALPACMYLSACGQTPALDCDTVATFRGDTYLPRSVDESLPLGERVGFVMLPATFSDPEADSCERTARVPAFAVPGVEPGTAVAIRDGETRLYVSSRAREADLPQTVRSLID